MNMVIDMTSSTHNIHTAHQYLTPRTDAGFRELTSLGQMYVLGQGASASASAARSIVRPVDPAAHLSRYLVPLDCSLEGTNTVAAWSPAYDGGSGSATRDESPSEANAVS